jgi:hypothetical protein
MGLREAKYCGQNDLETIILAMLKVTICVSVTFTRDVVEGRALVARSAAVRRRDDGCGPSSRARVRDR